MNDVLTKEEVVLNQVPDNSAEKCDVAACADRYPDVRERTRPRKSWIDMNDGRAALLRFHHPAEADRVSFGHRRAFD